jgi:hypothetical protein
VVAGEVVLTAGSTSEDLETSVGSAARFVSPPDEQATTADRIAATPIAQRHRPTESVSHALSSDQPSRVSGHSVFTWFQ